MTVYQEVCAGDVVDYLRSLPHCKDVRPCHVTIGKVTYPGAYYVQVNEWKSGMDGVVDGRHKVGETYEQRAIYLVGKRPFGLPRFLANSCYAIEGKDWYIACHTDTNKPLDKQFEQFHPFGYMFIIMPWDVVNSTIDQYEPRPYERTQIQVEYLDTK
jgi:hypothetical protein